MTLTAEEIVLCEAAKRMLSDPHFNAVLKHIIEDATAKSVFLHEQPEREANRQLVLAIGRVREELEAAAAAPEAEKAVVAHSRSME